MDSGAMRLLNAGENERRSTAGWAVLVAIVALIPFGLAATADAAPVDWSPAEVVADQPPFGSPGVLVGLSCPTASLCVGVDDFGNIISSSNPTGGSAAWKTVHFKETDVANGFTGIVCPSESLCIATDADGNVITSANPTGPASAWTSVHLPGSIYLSDLDCSTTSFCMAAQEPEEGDTNAVYSTNPAGGAAAWHTEKIRDGSGLRPKCVSSSLCVATLPYADTEKVLTSTDPTDGESWTETTLTGSRNIANASCSASGVCIVDDNRSGGDALYVSTDPTGGSGSWIEAGIGRAVATACPAANLCLVTNGSQVYTSTNPAGGTGAWSLTATGVTIEGLSCPTTTFCVGYDNFGNILASANPTGNSAAWTTTHVDDAGTTALTAAACGSASFCVLGDNASHVYTSTNPTGGAAGWHRQDVGGDHVAGISCVDTAFCAAVASGTVYTSTDPASNPSHWAPAAIDFGGALLGISCPGTDLCVASDSDGNILTSTNPTGGVGAWSKIGVDSTPASYRLNVGPAVSCPTTTFCTALDGSGTILTSTNPTGGVGAWSATTINADPEAKVVGISCPTSALCVAINAPPWYEFTANYEILSSTNPTGGAGAWQHVVATDSSNIACPSTTLCVTSGVGRGLFTSTHLPTGPANAWEVTADEEGDFLHASIYSLACGSTSLCIAGDGNGGLRIGAPGKGEAEGGEEGGSGSGGGTGSGGSDSRTATADGTPTVHRVAQGPAMPAVFAGLGLVVNGTVEVKVQCTDAQACRGFAKLIVKVKGWRDGKRRRRARPPRGRRAEQFVIGHKHFVIAPGSAGIVAIKLSRKGRQLLNGSGKHGLKVQLVGTGLKNRALLLRPK